jgi:hypothetical protein
VPRGRRPSVACGRDGTPNSDARSRARQCVGGSASRVEHRPGIDWFATSEALSPRSSVGLDLGLDAATLEDLQTVVHRGIDRIRAAWHLPYSFLRHCGLSL